MLWIGTALAIIMFVALGLGGVELLLTEMFWVDAAVGLIVAIFFVGLVQTPCALGRFLSFWPIAKLGSFAYSLYLTHVLVLPFVIGLLWAGPFVNHPYLSYFSVAAVMLPIALVFAYLFFWLFERPFLTIRSVGAVAGGDRARAKDPRRSRKTRWLAYPIDIFGLSRQTMTAAPRHAASAAPFLAVF